MNNIVLVTNLDKKIISVQMGGQKHTAAIWNTPFANPSVNSGSEGPIFLCRN